MTRIIAVDIGNTWTKCAPVEDGVIRQGYSRWPTEQTKLYANVAVSLLTPAPIVVASVVPSGLAAFEQAFRAGEQAFVALGSDRQSIVSNPPAELGDDLLAGAIAARKLYAPDKHLIVVGLGTAATMVRIRSDGRFDGAYIDLGLTPTFNELARHCSMIPRVCSSEVGNLKPGFSTKDALLAGVLLSRIGGVEKWIAEARQGMRGDTVVVATGGWSAKVAEHTDCFDHVDADLVLKGIYFWYEDACHAGTDSSPVKLK